MATIDAASSVSEKSLPDKCMEFVRTTQDYKYCEYLIKQANSHNGKFCDARYTPIHETIIEVVINDYKQFNPKIKIIHKLIDKHIIYETTVENLVINKTT